MKDAEAFVSVALASGAKFDIRVDIEYISKRFCQRKTGKNRIIFNE